MNNGDSNHSDLSLPEGDIDTVDGCEMIGYTGLRFTVSPTARLPFFAEELCGKYRLVLDWGLFLVT